MSAQTNLALVVHQEMVDDATPVRIRDFHAVCGARIFTGWNVGESAARYFASADADAPEVENCPACGEPLRLRMENAYHAGTCEYFHGGTHLHSTVITAFEMEQRQMKARERMCAGEPIDGEAIVCMSAELEDGLTFDELAPLYGREAETLRGEIAAFTTTTKTKD